MGEDLRGLGEHAFTFTSCWDDVHDDDADDTPIHHDADVTCAASIPRNLFSYFGSEVPPGMPPRSAHTYVVNDIQEMHLAGMNGAPGVDIVELCGGEGRCTVIARRRRLQTGENFDIITGVDLTDPDTQDQVIRYLVEWKVLVVVMAPVCRPFGPWARFNRMMHYQSWKQSYDEAAPLAQFCGRVALLQLESRRHFLNEQPKGSDLYLEPPWNIVLQWPGVVHQDFDQCMTGLRANNGLLVKKTTRLIASHKALVHYFRAYVLRRLPRSSTACWWRSCF